MDSDCVCIYLTWLKEEGIEPPKNGAAQLPILRLIDKAKQIGFDNGLQFARDNPNYEATQ